MSLTFNGADREFAAATGNNVNVTGNLSKFDGPPSALTDLVVTSTPGHSDPRLFGVGDMYEVSWQGGTGANSIQNAVVVRSDFAPGTGGIIVFEGTDVHGNVAHIVWTPEFDVDAWYDANVSAHSQPRFYTTDQNAPYTHRFVCFASEAMIACPDGARPAGALGVGDLVNTLDHGPQPVRWVGCKTQPGHGHGAPVSFAPGSIGNEAPLRLSQQHRVLLASPLAELLFDAPEVLVPAKALIDGHDVRLTPCARITYVHLLLDHHSILLAEGAPCESLLLGDQAVQVLDVAPQIGVMGALPDALLHSCRHQRAARPVLTKREVGVLTGVCPPSTSPPQLALA